MPNQPSAEDVARRAALSKAKDRLAAQLLENPAVSLIDIGMDPQETPGQTLPLVLRVHLRSAGARQSMPIPKEVDGIPVCTIIADYQLE